MNAEFRRRVFAVFDEACDLDEPARSAVLTERCGSDAELRRAVERMLRTDTEGAAELKPGAAAELLAAEIADDPTEPIPRQIGRYRVLREIGRGGMGIVYEAEQDHPHRRVAVKVIRGAAAGREVLRRFQREAELLGRLQHPGIAQIYEAGADVSAGIRRPFYAMELIDGLPLDRHADEHGLTVKQRVELIARVCDAVQHAHQKGILHRDLKAANVLVTAGENAGSRGSATAAVPTGAVPTGAVPTGAVPTGARRPGTRREATGSGSIDAIGQPKIVDFGIARLTDEADALTQQTSVGQIIGSLACMSPEQLTGDRDAVDTRTDVYAAGVLLYRLLAGRSPHDLTGLSIPEAARAITEREPRNLGSTNPALRGDLSIIAAKALERDPALRYISVADLGEDLRRSLRDEPISARSTARLYRIRKFATRHKAGVASVLVALLLLIAATAVSVRFGLRESDARQEADRAAYRASISAAAAALRDGDARLARAFLDEAPPERRGWEWWHYAGNLDASVASGIRMRPWTGEVADFLWAGCWLGEDGAVLHTASRYQWRAEEVFESFDASTLRALGHWSRPETERCVGIRRNPMRAVLLDETSGEFVTRDPLTGDADARRPAPDGAVLLFASYEMLPDDEDATDRLLRANVVTHESYSWMSTFSPRGSHTMSWFSRDPALTPVDESEATVRFGARREGTSRARFSPDGSSIAIATLDRRLDLHDTSTGERLWGHADAHTDAPMSIAFSNDGRFVATGGQDRVIKLWDSADGAPIGTLIGHKATVVALCFSADDRTLFSADARGVRRWRVRDAIDPGVVARHSTFVGALDLSPDGSMLVSRVRNTTSVGASTTEIMVLATDSESPARPVQMPPGVEYIWQVAFLTDTDLGILARHRSREDASSETVVLIRVDARTAAVTGVLELGPISDVTFEREWSESRTPLDPRGELLQIRSDEPLFVDLSTNRVVREPPLLPAASPRFRTGESLDWVDSNDRLIRRLGPIEGGIRSAVADRARSRAYVASQTGLVRVFDLDTGDVLDELGPSGTVVESLALLPDGSRLFGGSRDTAIRVWDTSTLQLVAVLRGHKDKVNDLVLTPDGSTLYSASDDYTVRRWSSTVVGARE